MKMKLLLSVNNTSKLRILYQLWIPRDREKKTRTTVLASFSFQITKRRKEKGFQRDWKQKSKIRTDEKFQKFKLSHFLLPTLRRKKRLENPRAETHEPQKNQGRSGFSRKLAYKRTWTKN